MWLFLNTVQDNLTKAQKSFSPSTYKAATCAKPSRINRNIRNKNNCELCTGMYMYMLVALFVCSLCLDKTTAWRRSSNWFWHSSCTFTILLQEDSCVTVPLVFLLLRYFVTSRREMNLYPPQTSQTSLKGFWQKTQLPVAEATGAPRILLLNSRCWWVFFPKTPLRVELLTFCASTPRTPEPAYDWVSSS